MNTQKKILLLLLCAVVAMVVYAINPIDWSFASQPLKKIKIAMLQEINDTTASSSCRAATSCTVTCPTA